MRARARLERLERRAPPGASPFCQCPFLWEEAIGLLTGETPLEALCPRCNKPYALRVTTEQEQQTERLLEVLLGEPETEGDHENTAAYQ